MAKGKRVFDHDLARERPEDAEIERLVIGPSGNLRAPTIRRGKTLLVGFSEEAYGEILG